MRFFIVVSLAGSALGLRTGDRRLPPRESLPRAPAAASEASAPAAASAASPEAAVAASPAPARAPLQAAAVAIPEQALVRGRIPDAEILPPIDRNPVFVNNDTLSEEAFDGAEPVFGDLDCLDRDNVLTLDEAATFGVKNGVPWSEVKPIFEYLDSNGDGEVTVDEFNDAKPDSEKMIQDFRPGFRDIDLDGNNLISRTEWMAFCNGWMSPHPTKQVCEELFNASDTARPTEEIDRSEFENAGKECVNIDDGRCAEFVQMVAHHSARRVKLAAIVQASWQPRTGAELFSELLRRHKRKHFNL